MRLSELNVATIDGGSQSPKNNSKNTKDPPETSAAKEANNNNFRRRSVRVKRSNNARIKRSRAVTGSAIPLKDLEGHASSDRLSPEVKKLRSHNRKYRIRPMEMKDCAAVYQLGNSIFTASEFPNMYRTWDDFAVIANYSNSAEFCYVVIGEISIKDKDDDNNYEDDENEEIIGFLLGDSITKTNLGTRGYIQWVAVAPPYRRNGIASDLLNKFCEVAKAENISLLLADTPADNAPAIRLFERVGLKNKQDHVYLTKQLKDVETQHVDDDGYYDFNYSVKGQRLRIRPMEIDDLYPIYLIGEEIFTRKNANLFHFWDESLVMHSYLSDPEYCITAVSKDEDGKETVVGFAFGTTIEKPRSSWRYGYLVWLGIHPDFQGLGLANQVFNTAVELFALEKVRMLMIDTQQNNEGALRFFRKLGFGHDEEHVYLSNAPAREGSIDIILEQQRNLK